MLTPEAKEMFESSDPAGKMGNLKKSRRSRCFLLQMTRFVNGVELKMSTAAV